MRSFKPSELLIKIGDVTLDPTGYYECKELHALEMPSNFAISGYPWNYVLGSHRPLPNGNHEILVEPDFNPESIPPIF